MNNGLYFYKLSSPYSEDITKNCKLTVEDIDSNFVSLKDADVSAVTYDKETQVLSLVRNDQQVIETSLSGLTQDLEVVYDDEEGIITLSYNGQEVAVTGLITQKNLYDIKLSQLKTDGTLKGTGNIESPLRLACVEKTGYFKPAIKLIDETKGEKLPEGKMNISSGERYVLRKKESKYGLLYNFATLEKIATALENGWRIPTKEDWDDMLNAVEPCEEDRNHNSDRDGLVLGRYAGKMLKTDNGWKDVETADLEDDNQSTNATIQLGSDVYGMSITPAGCADQEGQVYNFLARGYYWTSTQKVETDLYIKRFDYDKEGVWQYHASASDFHSLRLVKDYNGNNKEEYEDINGSSYRTVLLPSLSAESGYKVWTAENFYNEDDDYETKIPNNGEGDQMVDFYYIKEWNGDKWESRKMLEGEQIVLLENIDGRKNIGYKIIDNQLVSEKEVTDELYTIIGDGFSGSSITEAINDNANKIADAEEQISTCIATEAELKDEIDDIDDRAKKIIQSGEYDNNSGLISLHAEDAENDFTIQLNSNFGNLADFVRIKPEDCID